MRPWQSSVAIPYTGASDGRGDRTPGSGSPRRRVVGPGLGTLGDSGAGVAAGANSGMTAGSGALTATANGWREAAPLHRDVQFRDLGMAVS